MAEAEIVALLAVQRLPDGAYRYSANAIAALVGGTRATVLDQIRALRNLPELRPLTPEQERARRELGLA